MESFFITVQIAIVKVRVLIEPKAQPKGLPAPAFVHDNLTAFKFHSAGLSQPTASPDLLCFQIDPPAVIGPKNRSGPAIFRCSEQKVGVRHGNIVSIEQKNFPES